MKFLMMGLLVLISFKAMAVEADFSTIPLSLYTDSNETRVELSYASTARYGKNWYYAGRSQFVLYDKATVTLTTKYHDTRVDEWNEFNQEIDTVLYLYSSKSYPNDPIIIDDNSGENKFSKIETELEAGTYIVVSQRKWEKNKLPKRYQPIVDLHMHCSGKGCRKPIPAPRKCGYDEEWNCVIGESINDDRVHASADSSKMSKEVEKAIGEAYDEITGRRFPGTDYGAEVESVLEIYRSETDRTVIAYAVIGGGCGEPDYCDQQVYGIDLNGNIVYFFEDSW